MTSFMLRARLLGQFLGILGMNQSIHQSGLGLAQSFEKYNLAWCCLRKCSTRRPLTFEDNVLQQTAFLHRNFGLFKKLEASAASRQGGTSY